MTQQPDPADVPPTLPALKIVEPEVNEDDPWGDDVLDRKEIADRLTSIVREQDAPFVISIDGRWGTGKTFLLKRWAQDLQNQDPPWQAIYYNAWEDDFAGDPLLSITGQLSEHFGNTTFADRVRKLGDLIPPLLRFGASAATVATIGVPVPISDLTDRQPSPSGSLADYLDKRAAKDKLKESLSELATEVREKTGQPLVFVIDELDRCRPTFAIELLERVKHILGVPNIVFVFGINRSELTESLRSVYGDIDAGTYLRRFFDMEFVLPDADPEQFCKHLVEKFRLGPFFSEVDQRLRDPYYTRELDNIARFLPLVLGRLRLALRDMDYCVRLIALAAREALANQGLYAPLLVLLAATKLRDPDLYRRFVQGDARGAELINHLNEQRPPGDPAAQGDSTLRGALKWLEAAAYCADDPDRSLQQLRRLQEGGVLDQPEYISSELARIDVENEEIHAWVKDIIRIMEENPYFRSGRYEAARRSLAERIDIYAGLLRR